MEKGNGKKTDLSSYCKLKFCQMSRADPSAFRCVMGHTHNLMQVSIRITSRASGELEQIYLNTGAWRKKHIKGQGGGFIGLEHLTYTIIYSEQENALSASRHGPGSLKKVP